MTETARANSSRTYTDAQKASQLKKCWELRRDGISLREIAKRTKLPLTTVHRRVAEALEAYVSPARDEVRAWEDARLDRVVEIAVQVAETSLDEEIRLKALDRVMKASERRARMHGADEPERSIVSTDNTHHGDSELAKLLAGMSKDVEDTLVWLNNGNAAP